MGQLCPGTPNFTFTIMSIIDLPSGEDEIADNQRLLCLHRSCAQAVHQNANNAIAIHSAIARMTEAGYPSSPEPEVTSLIQRYREAIDDFGESEALSCDVFLLNCNIARIQAQKEHDAVFAPLTDACPLVNDNTKFSRAMEKLYPNGERILLFKSHHKRSPVLWHTGMHIDWSNIVPWYHPMPVNYEPDTVQKALILCPEAVADWNSACAIISPAQMQMLTPQILAKKIAVRSIVSISERRACVTFTVNAKNKAAWNAKCRELKKLLADLGVTVPRFRYDWLAHAPGYGPDNRLVYLAP